MPPSPSTQPFPPPQPSPDGEGEARRQCVMEVWGRADRVASDSQSPIADSQAEAGSSNEWTLESTEVLMREQQPLSFIPFVFHGARHARPEPDFLPLADIIAANLDHYRLDADYKHGLHFTILPTAYVCGFDKTDLRIGSSSVWQSGELGASVGFLEFSGRGLAHLERALEKVERRMTLLGAHLAMGGDENQMSGLGTIVAGVNESVSSVLRLAQWWVQGGELEQMAASFAMNTDLDARAMSGDELSAVVAAWRAGAISRDTMLEKLKRGEVLPEGRSVAQERALIHGKGDGR